MTARLTLSDDVAYGGRLRAWVTPPDASGRLSGVRSRCERVPAGSGTRRV